MSPSAILAVLALNLWLLVVGAGVFFGLCGWASWLELARLSGFAYMCGVAASGIAWVWQLTLGIDMSLVTIFVSGVVVGGAGVGAGLLRGRRLPPLPVFRAPLPVLSLMAASIGAITAVYLEAQFRAGRLAGLYEFDAWSFWVPKAKAIYYFGGLDSQFFHDLPGQSYPPLVPALEAACFHFMGSVDVVTMRVQFWFLLVGFVGAVAGLLSGRVPVLLLWTPLLLVLVTPYVVDHALEPQADLLLDEFFALGILLLALWLEDRQDWHLCAAALFLAAAMLTKREGYVLGLCGVVSALVVTRFSGRGFSSKIAIVGLVAAAFTVPWRAFLLVRDLEGGGPEAGGIGLLSHTERAWPSLRLTVSTLFDVHVWLMVVPLFVVALIVGLITGDRQISGYAALVFLLCIGAFTWGTWAFPSLPVTKAASLNPIVRFSGSFVLAAACLMPLLLRPAQRAGARR